MSQRKRQARGESVLVMKHITYLSLLAGALLLSSCDRPAVQWNQETLPPGDTDRLPPSQTVPGQPSPGDVPVSNRPQGS